MLYVNARLAAGTRETAEIHTHARLVRESSSRSAQSQSRTAQGGTEWARIAKRRERKLRGDRDPFRRAIVTRRQQRAFQLFLLLCRVM